MIETKRLKIYAASKEQMEAFIVAQSDKVLKKAYTEMMDGALAHPDMWEWYAIWMIEFKDGSHIPKHLNPNQILKQEFSAVASLKYS